MTQSSASLEWKRLQAVAREYEGRGYRVIKRPSKASLPDFLAAFRPDLIAYGPEENVVVEVETKATLPRANDLIALSDAVNAKPGWRLELIVTNDRSTTVDGSTEELGDHEIRDRVERVRKLLELDQEDAAALLAWSAAEAALRIICRREGIRVDGNQPASMTEQLYSLGVLSRADYELLREAFKLRNVIVHGYRSPAGQGRFIGELASKVEELLTLTKDPAA